MLHCAHDIRPSSTIQHRIRQRHLSFTSTKRSSGLSITAQSQNCSGLMKSKGDIFFAIQETPLRDLTLFFDTCPPTEYCRAVRSNCNRPRQTRFQMRPHNPRTTNEGLPWLTTHLLTLGKNKLLFLVGTRAVRPSVSWIRFPDKARTTSQEHELLYLHNNQSDQCCTTGTFSKPPGENCPLLIPSTNFLSCHETKPKTPHKSTSVLFQILSNNRLFCVFAAMFALSILVTAHFLLISMFQTVKKFPA